MLHFLLHIAKLLILHPNLIVLFGKYIIKHAAPSQSVEKHTFDKKVEETETWLRVDNDGFERDVDTVTLFAGHGPIGCIDQISRTPDSLVAMLLLQVSIGFAFFGLPGAGTGWGEGCIHLLCSKIYRIPSSGCLPAEC